VVVVGLGQTGFAMVDTLCELGAEVTAIARDAPADVLKLSGVVGANVVVDADESIRLQALENLTPDLAVVSPGVLGTDPVAQELVTRGVSLWSDLELAWRLRDKGGPPADWLVVLHDPGNTTTVEVAERIFQAASHRTRVVGAGAPPVLDALREPVSYESLIIQVTPESLIWRERYPTSLLSPRIAVSLAEEGSSRSGVFFDGTSHACVYRKALGPSEAQVEDANVVEGARAIGIGVDSPGMSDIGVVEGIVVDRAFLDDRAHQAIEITTLEELGEAGWAVPRELPALLAAIAIARSRDVLPAVIAGVLSLP